MTVSKALRERIDNFLEDQVEAGLIALQPIRSRATLAGAYDSSRRIILENQSLQEHYRITIAKIAWLIFQAANNDQEAFSLLDEAARKLAERLAEHRARQRQNTSPGLVGRMQSELVERLNRAAADASFDFSIGVAGDETLKKGVDLSINTTMSNSPGGTQQVGVGEQVSQQVTQTFAPLITELDRLEGSAEFQALDGEKQAEIRELVEDIRDEARKQNPSTSRLQRFGGYLGAKLMDFGLTTAATTIGTILATLAQAGGAH